MQMGEASASGADQAFAGDRAAAGTAGELTEAQGEEVGSRAEAAFVAVAAHTCSGLGVSDGARGFEPEVESPEGTWEEAVALPPVVVYTALVVALVAGVAEGLA